MTDRWTVETITEEKVAKTIDHSLLRPELTLEEVLAGCALAAAYQVASVCCRPLDVGRCAGALEGAGVLVGTVVGFPHGSSTTAVKVAEAERALDDGAAELDMVLPIGWLRSGEDAYVHDDIAAVTVAAHARGAIVKVILENAYLSDEQKVRGCELSEKAGADYVKTSTGYAPSGSTMDDLRLMRASVSERVKIKAAGGIRTLDLLIEGLNAGHGPLRGDGDRRHHRRPEAAAGLVTRRYLGIDVGGTSCKLAVLEVDGDRAGPPPKLLATAVLPTGPGGPDEVLDRLAAEGARLAAEHGPVAAAGAGVPGLFDEASGRTLFLPNLPAAWNGREFGRPLAGRLGVPTVLINDARAFTLAESRMGAAAGCSTVVCLTLGTGVGGGVVVDGRLRYGPHGRAGEVGHQVIDPNGPRCGCGNRGCVEAFAAGAALSRLGGQDSPQAVFRAAAAGDELAAAAVQAVAWRLAVGIANLVTVLWPERVVVGGGVAAAGERLLGPLRAAVADATPLVDPASYEIVPAALGPAAGAIGAALWAEERAGVREG